MNQSRAHWRLQESCICPTTIRCRILPLLMLSAIIAIAGCAQRQDALTSGLVVGEVRLTEGMTQAPSIYVEDESLIVEGFTERSENLRRVLVHVYVIAPDGRLLREAKVTPRGMPRGARKAGTTRGWYSVRLPLSATEASGDAVPRGSSVKVWHEPALPAAIGDDPKSTKLERPQT